MNPVVIAVIVVLFVAVLILVFKCNKKTENMTPSRGMLNSNNRSIIVQNNDDRRNMSQSSIIDPLFKKRGRGRGRGGKRAIIDPLFHNHNQLLH